MLLAPVNLERQDTTGAVEVAAMMAMGEEMELCHQVGAEWNCAVEPFLYR
jgi:hypothetical protein